MNFGISVFVTLAHIASNLNSLKHEINDKEKIGFTKYSREKNSDPRNTHKKKFRNHENPRSSESSRFFISRYIALGAAK